MSKAIRERERDAAIKKNQKHKSRKRKKKALAAFFAVLFITATVLGVLSVTYFFKITTINIEGNLTYTSDEIINSASIDVGDNLLILSEKDISSKLSKRLPFIDSVKLEKTYPDSLKITVTETKEEICFKTKDKAYSANLDGKILKEYDAVPITLTFISVSDNTSFSLGEKVEFATELEANVAQEYLRMLGQYDFNINFINMTDPYDSYLKVENRFVVKMGSSSNLEFKAAHLNETLKKTADDAIGVFDLSAWSHDKKGAYFSEKSIADILE